MYSNKKSKYEYASNKKHRRKYNKVYYGRVTDADNSRKPWTTKEVELIMRHDVTDTELAIQLGRTLRAIQTKRCKSRNSKKYGYQ